MEILGNQKAKLEVWEQILKECDTDGNGVIDMNEFINMMVALGANELVEENLDEET